MQVSKPQSPIMKEEGFIVKITLKGTHPVALSSLNNYEVSTQVTSLTGSSKAILGVRVNKTQNYATIKISETQNELKQQLLKEKTDFKFGTGRATAELIDNGEKTITKVLNIPTKIDMKLAKETLEKLNNLKVKEISRLGESHLVKITLTENRETILTPNGEATLYPFKPREKICYHCQSVKPGSMGHISTRCPDAKKPAICGLCSGNHNIKQCPNPTNLKCAACSDSHKRTDCPRLSQNKVENKEKHSIINQITRDNFWEKKKAEAAANKVNEKQTETIIKKQEDTLEKRLEAFKNEIREENKKILNSFEETMKKMFILQIKTSAMLQLSEGAGHPRALLAAVSDPNSDVNTILDKVQDVVSDKTAECELPGRLQKAWGLSVTSNDAPTRQPATSRPNVASGQNTVTSPPLRQPAKRMRNDTPSPKQPAASKIKQPTTQPPPKTNKGNEKKKVKTTFK